MDAALIGQGLLSGLLFGGVYSLMAVGLTLIFGVMRVVNFAHGDMMVWGMYLAWMLATRLGVDPYAGFVLCAGGLFVVGFVVQRTLVDRIVDAPHEMQILLMLGVALVLENAALVAFGPDPQRVRSALTASTLWLGPIFVDVGRLVTFGLAVLLTGALYLFLARTPLGRSVRAAADNPYGALVIGTDVRRVYAVAFGIGADVGAPLVIGLIVVVSALVAWLCLRVIHRASLKGTVLLAVAAGGGIGNLLDRILRADHGPLTGRVVDFIAVDWFAVFNVADIFTTCGIALWALTQLHTPTAITSHGISPRGRMGPARKGTLGS